MTPFFPLDDDDGNGFELLFIVISDTTARHNNNNNKLHFVKQTVPMNEASNSLSFKTNRPCKVHLDRVVPARRRRILETNLLIVIDELTAIMLVAYSSNFPMAPIGPI